MEEPDPEELYCITCGARSNDDVDQPSETLSPTDTVVPSDGLHLTTQLMVPRPARRIDQAEAAC